MTRLLFFLILLVLLTGASNVVSAQKIEREYKLELSEVPNVTQVFIEANFPEHGKVRYYLDVGEVDTTIESKFSISKQRYSVEFSSDGEWLDTETEIPISAVPKDAWQSVCAVYAAKYERWRVDRVQVHDGGEHEFYYEIEIMTRKDFVWDRRQVRLTPEGTILEDVLIKLAPGHLDRW